MKMDFPIRKIKVLKRDSVNIIESGSNISVEDESEYAATPHNEPK